ncbi:MAG TPA: branched-chain amino acid transaminase [Chloroflexota bacterium]
MASEPYAYFNGDFVPLSQAKVSIMTHALNYGTGCFEGIRGNWNAERGELYLFRLKEHFERLERSCRILKIKLPKSVDELCEITLELARRNGYQEDIYVRPIAYKGQSIVGVRLHNVEDAFSMFMIPFGNYLDTDAGIRCGTVGWRRVDDAAIPARAKVTGIYINGALAKTEAIENGFDEAILLTNAGFVSEGSGENIFMVSDGALITPAQSESILVGITRDSVIKLAREELGIPTIERQIAKSELYTSQEVFMTGTAAHITPVLEVDHRQVGTGSIGTVTSKLMKLYFDAITGRNKKYIEWCSPVHGKAE